MRWRQYIGSAWSGILTLGLVGNVSFGQAPAPTAERAPAAADSRSVTDLSTRFRFVERYDVTQPKSSNPAQIGQYRVVARDTIKVVTEKPQGTPERTEASQDTDYRERPAEISGDKVKAAVRSYDLCRITPNPSSKPSRPDPLKGMVVWYEPHEGSSPLVLSLTQGRILREDEYTILRREIYLPDLMQLLPTVPTRVGDRWSVSKLGRQALLGPLTLPLTGVLQQVRQAAEGPNWEAVIGVSGRTPARSPAGSLAVNARLVFSFPPPGAPGAEEPKNSSGEKVVDASGAILELRMGTSAVTPLPPNGRLRQTVNRELILDRRLDETGEPLTLPTTRPEPTDENSWLSYDDPQGRFHFRYPQDFRPGRLPDELSVELVRNRPGGPDTLEFQRIIKTGDAEADRLNRDPQFHLKMLKEEWRKSRYDVIPGPQAWLPEADWAATNRKVYRAESVLKAAATGGKGELRVQNNFYFVLFGGTESLIMISNTVQDPATPYRNQVETILKSFEFGATGTAH